ncbi:MAG: hypothetical protein H6873_03275 [Hyphomicrobiaceae bacterium]|nr:hypothetical protein [Hyphomicrobiaceae bacterium]
MAHQSQTEYGALRRAAKKAAMFALAAVVAVFQMATMALGQNTPNPGYVGSTSEEYPPIVCPRNSYAYALSCSGDNCDNVGVECHYSGNDSAAIFDPSYNPVRWVGETFTAPPVSEENGGMACPYAPSALVGIGCSGSRCDNVTLICVHINTVAGPMNCVRTPWFSEEPPGYGSLYQVDIRLLPTGLHCRGKYCDDMSLEGCIYFGAPQNQETIPRID